MAKRVILGLSGGVDSSVSALLLKNQGYEVIGLYINNFDVKQDDDINLRDARKISETLGIKLETVNLVDKNKDYVFDYFINEYKAGRTPSPCMICNREIKFKAFLDIARGMNADYIATGHYAKIEEHNGVKCLMKGTDPKKDQSYFLAFMTKDEIEHTLFPVGHMTKDEVKKIALENDLVTATKKESMDICFIGKEGFNDFIKNYIPINKGKMMTLDGKFIKNHDGLQFYTIGQRKGLSIGGLNGYSNEPWFTIGKDFEKNILYVGQGFHNEYLYSNRAICKKASFESIPIDESKEYYALFRYHSTPRRAHIKMLDNDSFEITYESERAVTPGQGCVIYDGDICLGGGLIDSVYNNEEKRKY